MTAEATFAPRDKVFVRSLNRSGMIRKVENHPTWGPQYMVSVYDAMTPEETNPFSVYWVRESDLEMKEETT